MARPTEFLPWLLIPALAAIGAAAGAQLQAKQVAAPHVIYEMDGYRVLAPPGKDWFELKRDRQYVYFGKQLSSRTHSFIAVAMSTSLSEKFDRPQMFLEHVSRSLSIAGDARNRIVESRAELDAALGPYCVRHYTKAEDRGALYAKGQTLLAETVGVSCLHAENRGLSVDVSYTERGHPAEINAALRAEGESFVRSLKFITRDPLRAAPP